MERPGHYRLVAYVLAAVGLLVGTVVTAPAGETRASQAANHWAFQHLRKPHAPAVKDSAGRARNDVDRFLLARLEAQGLSIGPEADRVTLVRRVCFDLTGLPPTPAEVEQFTHDSAPDAYERMVERYLASPHYGERWGQFWLDAAGYADSSGYFSNERDRPLAYRYRDYVIDSFNRDEPFDQFVCEQLAGDELADVHPDKETPVDALRPLIATHYLSNAPDGTDQSAPSPEAMRVDRYAALEGTQQIVASSLLGLSLKCARCHDHKFEPISQKEYYQVQSIFSAALDPANWVPPLQRTVRVKTPADVADYKARVADHDRRLAGLKFISARLSESISARERQGTTTNVSTAAQSSSASTILFSDDTSEPLASRWVSTAPVGAENEAVSLDAEVAGRHSALRMGTALRIVSRKNGESLLATKQQFDWTPDAPGQSIQATFDLVADRTEIGGAPSPPAAYFGYFLSAHSSFKHPDKPHGNVLIEGNTQTNPGLYFDYPGDAARKVPLGISTYVPGHNYGVRITNVGAGTFQLLHLVDGLPDGDPLTVPARDLPDGGFAFAFGADRSFVVDHLTVRAGTFAEPLTPAQQLTLDRRRQVQIDREIKVLEGEQPQPTGAEIAWVSERSAAAPQGHILKRGNYADLGEEVQPGALAILTDADNAFAVAKPEPNARTSGRRLALARWLTKPGSRPAALMARVQVNRIWQNHFGKGLVPTPDNFGVSGKPPTQPELLEYLAASFVESGWRIKSLHRLILCSSAYRQSSVVDADVFKADPDNTLYGRFPLRRLDAESIRDTMLAVSGELDLRAGGPVVPIDRYGSVQEKQRGALNREIVVNENTPGARRRSIYLEHRRTQIPTALALFGTPSISLNCVERSTATVPLQSLAQLNSEFVRLRAEAAAERLMREAGDEPDAQITLAFRLAIGRAPSAEELDEARAFISSQSASYLPEEKPRATAITDFCQMLFASNPFMYVE